MENHSSSWPPFLCKLFVQPATSVQNRNELSPGSLPSFYDQTCPAPGVPLHPSFTNALQSPYLRERSMYREFSDIGVSSYTVPRNAYSMRRNCLHSRWCSWRSPFIYRFPSSKCCNLPKTLCLLRAVVHSEQCLSPNSKSALYVRPEERKTQPEIAQIALHNQEACCAQEAAGMTFQLSKFQHRYTNTASLSCRTETLNIPSIVRDSGLGLE